MTEPIFVGRSLSCHFRGVAALTELNFEIYPGEKVGLIGASGAGKSTLLSLLNGQRQPTQGELLIWGEAIATLSPRRRRRIQRQLGTIYQQLHLVESLAVIHNVNAGHLGRWSFLKALFSLVFPRERPLAETVLKQVGIPEKLFARTSDLSGGQKQRVALARVLVQNPAVILADEPIASLDPQLSREMMDLLVQLCETQGKTLVVSLHSLEFARSHCDRLIGLKAGQILFDQPTTTVSDAQIAHLYGDQSIY
ncbi:ABC transporter ATP-binding protein [Picosynechococcus sp. PCC 7003]|uniref:phosphonate ABC transporter ATP-binding protein n=1 Tax=Picosynechococcus sp. PCC 7003 TaxID=374981 RepID=UPI000810DCE9|nr:ATP-binding cassette domain-containing protein [Picosynechococcus sp. PCC 7003]ANV83541.1 ABC transporter ATP-binding protein [Picosynechococcus sp. PCC 7003]